MKKIFIVILGCTLIGLLPANAQEIEFAWTRKPVGASSTGMAGTGVLCDDYYAWAAFGSAAMPVLSNQKFAGGAGYSFEPFSKTNNTLIGVSGKLEKRLLLCGGASYSFMPKYDVFDGTGIKTGEFAPWIMQLGLGVGIRITKFLSIGANLKYAAESIATDATYGALSGYISQAFRLKGIRAGVGINSLGADLKGGKVAGFPSSGKLTIGYDDTIVSGKLALGAYLDSDYFFNNSSSAAAGLNIVALDMISLRAGYRYSSVKAPLASYASTGIGLKLWGVSLDASYIFGSRTLKNSFSISLGYSF